MVGGVGKPTSPQAFAEGRGLKGPESQRYDPKPGDLGQGKVKSLIRGMEACRGAAVRSALLTLV